MKLMLCFSLMLLVGMLAGCNSGKKIAAAQHPEPQVAALVEKTAGQQARAFSAPVPLKNDLFLEDLLKARPQQFEKVLTNRKAWKVQIIYTQIDRKANNEPVFTPFFFNYDPEEYFYPASTVKMPVALLALQKLHELSLPGLDKNSSLITEADYFNETPVLNDPSTPDGRPTVANYVKKIFMVSDNDAFNRLYELLGQDYIKNSTLYKKGYTNAAILHRLEVSMTPDENRHTNPIKFFDSSGHLLYAQPLQFNQTNYAERRDSAGLAYYKGNDLISHPMDFSKKNRFALEDLTLILRSVLFPLSVSQKQRFNLTEADYKFVKQYMSQVPTESVYPPYSADTAAYWPAFCKFLLLGSERGPLPKSIRIFNKVGDAYGFLTDVAYIVDFDKKIEFMLSARIYCNSDGVLNDNKYDYDTIGYPFMKELGKLIYQFELNRGRTKVPDLSEFKMQYDK